MNSSCIIEIAPNTYKCKNTDIIIRTNVLPVRCGFCDEKAVPEFPPLAQQAVNFGKAIVQHVVTGAKRVDEVHLKERMDICNSCEFFCRESGRCQQCGCFLIGGILGTEGKIFWAEQKCPSGKW